MMCVVSSGWMCVGCAPCVCVRPGVARNHEYMKKQAFSNTYIRVSTADRRPHWQWHDIVIDSALTSLTSHITHAHNRHFSLNTHCHLLTLTSLFTRVFSLSFTRPWELSLRRWGKAPARVGSCERVARSARRRTTRRGCRPVSPHMLPPWSIRAATSSLQPANRR